jgi:hypothetical protein
MKNKQQRIINNEKGDVYVFTFRARKRQKNIKTKEFIGTYNEFEDKHSGNLILSVVEYDESLHQ